MVHDGEIGSGHQYVLYTLPQRIMRPSRVCTQLDILYVFIEVPDITHEYFAGPMILGVWECVATSVSAIRLQCGGRILDTLDVIPGWTIGSTPVRWFLLDQFEYEEDFGTLAVRCEIHEREIVQTDSTEEFKELSREART